MSMPALSSLCTCNAAIGPCYFSVLSSHCGPSRTMARTPVPVNCAWNTCSPARCVPTCTSLTQPHTSFLRKYYMTCREAFCWLLSLSALRAARHACKSWPSADCSTGARRQNSYGYVVCSLSPLLAHDCSRLGRNREHVRSTLLAASGTFRKTLLVLRMPRWGEPNNDTNLPAASHNVLARS